MRFLARIAALFRLGSTEPAPIAMLQASNSKRRTRSYLEPIPVTRTRWYLADIERATRAADSGDLSLFAQLYRSLRGDGVFAGLLSTRTAGLVSLPKRFYGTPEVVEQLQSKTVGRSVFDQMFPPSELALLVADGIMLGVGLAEMVPVGEPEDRQPPVLRRMDPEFLYWNWAEGQWYYRSLGGQIPINPGDGRWVLHIPGGTGTPWHDGLVRACGRAYIVKEHAISMRQNYATKLANPARVAVSPTGSGEPQKLGWFRQVMAWGINTVFSAPVGYDVKLIESNGRGYEVWAQEEESSNHDFTIALAGQKVTTDGGAGFQNSDIHQAIRSDLIEASGNALAWTLNTQALPGWLEAEYGEDSYTTHQATVEWDCKPPKDRMAEASLMSQAAGGITSLTTALKEHNLELDVAQIAAQFGIPIRGDVDGDGMPDTQQAGLRLVPKAAESDTEAPAAEVEDKPDVKTIGDLIKLAEGVGLQPTKESLTSIATKLGISVEDTPGRTVRIDLAPTDIAEVVTADEARASQGLPEIGGDKGGKFISEIRRDARAAAVPEGAAPQEDDDAAA